MPIPFLIMAAVVVAGGAGAAAGVAGALDISDAKDRQKKAKRCYDSAVSKTETTRKAFMRRAQAYGEHQLRVADQTVGRYLDVVQRLGGGEGAVAMHILKDLQITPTELKQLQLVRVNALELSSGAVGAAVSGSAASSATVGLVGAFAQASTGTAISTLSGAAAQNATLAWLGGGSIASGGGGMAVGSAVLGGIAIAPALLIGGFALLCKGEEALTEVRKYERNVNTAVADNSRICTFLERAGHRVGQLQTVLCELSKATHAALHAVERARSARERQAALRRATTLIRGVAGVLKTPVLDASGNLTTASAMVVVKSRKLLAG